MATIRFPGGRGPAGAAGATGPAGPAGAGSITAPQAAWVNEAGVEGVDVAFDAADWQDAATAVPAAGCVAASVSVVGDALAVVAGSNGSSAINRPLELADGSDLCARVALAFGQNAFAGMTVQFQLAAFVAAGAATNWHGVGNRFGNQSILSGNFGKYYSIAGNINGAIASAALNSTGIFLTGTTDLRIRRTGATLLTYASIGGAWHLLAAADATGYTAGAGNMAGFRMLTGATDALTAKIVAWGYFPAGLPAGLQ